ncbi:TraR/DksA family transcriptional regulator [Acinetobacter baumannii]|uniref:TraR/DksA family transcriptional regulator n=1 Tax=Acinetobacter baumannii TaxID=470 RepID=UPI003977895F
MTVKNSPAELSSALANQRNDVPLIRYSGRLEARPTATLCIDCKTLAEIKEKQNNG